MTREEFDKVRWHKGMRCSGQLAALRTNQKPTTLHGTIMGVHFGGYFCKVLWDGKDCVSRWNCERLTIEN